MPPDPDLEASVTASEPTGVTVPLGSTGLRVSRLCLGGNVFGWTADRDESFAILDAYLEGGGTFIDTADVYSSWVDGNSGGESEVILGDWIRSRDVRDRVVVATKVGSIGGLSAANVAEKADACLRRLGIEQIDLLYAHRDDPSVGLEETLGALNQLVEAGKVRHLGASNFEADRLSTALEVSSRLGLARFEVLQPHYNLVEREYERDAAAICRRQGLACVPYYGLASGFLTGKYRAGTSASGRRAERSTKYLTPRGLRVLDALDEIASSHECAPTTVALAWLAAQPTVAAPIASASSREQLPDLLASMHLRLDAEQLRALGRASAD